jgi:aspartate racemase
VTASLQHFGILAHSAEGAALCFRTFCLEAEEKLGEHMHPDVTLDCIAMGRSMAAWDAGDYRTIREIHAKTIDRLAKAGAAFFACPDNTSHIALETQGPEFALPGLNIADVVADEAVRLSMSKVAVLGTKYTMEGPVYRRALPARGIEAAFPDADEREEINRIIFSELVKGIFTDPSRQAYVDIINRLKGEGCDGVALVCTEIPLLITPDISSMPTLDSTRLLARAALEVATGERALPLWRGGVMAAAA